VVDSTISRARMRDLTTLGRSRLALRAAERLSGRAVRFASRALTDATGIGSALAPRPRAASSRPETDDLVESTT